MNADIATTEEGMRNAVVEYAERCERWMQWAHQAARAGDVFRVSDCMQSAGFWSREAFREIAIQQARIAVAEAHPCAR